MNHLAELLKRNDAEADYVDDVSRRVYAALDGYGAGFNEGLHDELMSIIEEVIQRYETPKS